MKKGTTEMSIHNNDLFGKNKYDTTIERIKTYCSGKRVLCAFSGGKDSQVCYHLLKDAGIAFHAEYSITRFEPPELMSFVRAHYPDVTFRRAYKKSLTEEIAYRGLPSMWARWCCAAKHQKTDGYDIAVIGIRWEESSRRKKTGACSDLSPIRPLMFARSVIGRSKMFGSIWAIGRIARFTTRAFRA